MSQSLRPLSQGEQALLAAYQEAMKGALDAANTAAEFLATVAAAAITGYAALIGLVQPQNVAAPVVVGLPFVFFAIALVLAVVSRLVSVPITIENDLSKIEGLLTGRISSKRRIAVATLVVMLAGIVFSGYLIATTYPRPAAPSPSPSAASTQQPIP